MLDPNTIRIGDRVRDLIDARKGVEQIGTVVEIDSHERTVRIVWDWLSLADLCYMSTWYLEPLERPQQTERRAWKPTPSNS